MGHTQAQSPLLFMFPISRASSFVSGRGCPADSGSKNAMNPATTDVTPIKVIGSGFQTFAVSSTLRNKWMGRYSRLEIFLCYSEFQGFRSYVARQLFLGQFWPLLKQASFFEAAGAVSKIGSGLKSNHHWHCMCVHSLSLSPSLSAFKLTLRQLLSIDQKHSSMLIKMIKVWNTKSARIDPNLATRLQVPMDVDLRMVGYSSAEYK